MNKLKKVFLGFIVSVVSFSLMTSAVSAMEFRTGDTSVEQDEIVEEDLYIFGDTVEVEGSILGDLIVSGGDVTISGTVEGDVYASGGVVRIDGVIEKSLFVAGGQIEMSGDVRRSVYMSGGQMRFSSDSVVAEDIMASGGQMYLEGTVGDDIRVAGGSLDIDSVVSGDVMVYGGDINIEEDNVAGEVSINRGQVDWRDETEEARKGVRRLAQGFFRFGTFLRVATFIGMYAVGLIFIWLAPVKTKRIVAKVSDSGREAGLSLLYGIMGFAVLVVLPVVLMVTLIGIPLAFLLLMTGLLVSTFGVLFVEMGMGRSLLRLFGYKEENYALSLLGGRAVTLLIAWIPCLGALYKFTLFLLALGGVIRMKVDMVRDAKALTSAEEEKSVKEKAPESKPKTKSKKASKKKSKKSRKRKKTSKKGK